MLNIIKKFRMPTSRAGLRARDAKSPSHPKICGCIHLKPDIFAMSFKIKCLHAYL